MIIVNHLSPTNYKHIQFYKRINYGSVLLQSKQCLKTILVEMNNMTIIKTCGQEIPADAAPLLLPLQVRQGPQIYRSMCFLYSRLTNSGNVLKHTHTIYLTQHVIYRQETYSHSPCNMHICSVFKQQCPYHTR